MWCVLERPARDVFWGSLRKAFAFLHRPRSAARDSRTEAQLRSGGAGPIARANLIHPGRRARYALRRRRRPLLTRPDGLDTLPGEKGRGKSTGVSREGDKIFFAAPPPSSSTGRRPRRGSMPRLADHSMRATPAAPWIPGRAQKRGPRMDGRVRDADPATRAGMTSCWGTAAPPSQYRPRACP